MEHASHLSPEVLLRHEEFVLRLARTLVRGEADAEEVAQRTLASALTHPPRHGALRAWLVRVTKNHATELHRTERRRTAREQRVARPEAVAAEGSAMERLELEHGVVRAVLSLDEPYKSVVVATYYEGLAPAEIATRSGVPASTVRSQLTRAHELLRAKLDRTHGERGTWMSGLTGLLALRDVPSGAAGATASAATGGGSTATGASSVVGPLAIGVGIAACIAAVLVVRAVLAPPSAIETAVVEPVAVPVIAIASPLGASSPEPARSPVDAAAIAPTISVRGFVPADEPVKLLEQSRQIKKLILDRRLAVTPEERARAGIPTDTATSGVVRLLDRKEFGHAFSLPWMREGGSFYSFTERVHDYNRRPQISYEGGNLNSTLLVDLGDRRVASVPSSRVPPTSLAPVARFLWELAWEEYDSSKGYVGGQLASRIAAAETAGVVDAATAHAARNQDPRARPGRAFLLRDVAQDDHDVLVALEVVDVSPGQCTIAWRMLESRPIANPRTPYAAPDFAVQLPPPPTELAQKSELELRQALGAVRTRADEVLFLQFPPEVEKEFGGWRTRRDAGIARLLPYFSTWSELTTDPVGHADYSLLERRHGDYGDVSFQGERGRGYLGGGLSGGAHAVFVDLGTTPIDTVTEQDVAARGEAGAHAARHEFPHATDLPAVEPARQAEMRAASDRFHADWKEFDERARALGISDQARAIVGRTFGLRSVRFGSHDVLAAVQVVAEDERGVVIAWKVLKTWPVDRGN